MGEVVQLRMGEVVNLRDYLSQKDKERIREVLKEFTDTAPSEMVPYHGAGIDGIPYSHDKDSA